ncbi:MAG: VIT domain-containing protein, partial [Planctomycetota bacterium]
MQRSTHTQQTHPARSRLIPRGFHAVALALVAVIGALAPAQARGAGLLIADGGFGGRLEMVDHRVTVTINNTIAVTEVEQVFRNTEDRIVEALYTFPVPKDASVSNFSMWINGKEMVGEVLEKRRAREIYESYKVTRVDPGLLEQVDHKTFEMRIFPIAAGAEQRIRVTYYQQLAVDHDRATYVYPLATETRPGLDSSITGTFSFNARVLSEVPVASMGSPSHRDDMVIAPFSDRLYEASIEHEEGDAAATRPAGEQHLSRRQQPRVVAQIHAARALGAEAEPKADVVLAMHHRHTRDLEPKHVDNVHATGEVGRVAKRLPLDAR